MFLNYFKISLLFLYLSINLYAEERILVVTPSLLKETFPYHKAGGLENVVGPFSLLKSLNEAGFKADLAIPYWMPNNLNPEFYSYVEVPMPDFYGKENTVVETAVYVLENYKGSGVNVYLFSEPYQSGFFDSPKLQPFVNLQVDKYDTYAGTSPEQHQKYGFFQRAILEHAKNEKLKNKPYSIIATNDWATSIIPLYLKIGGLEYPFNNRYEAITNTGTIHIFHNIAYKGGSLLASDVWRYYMLPWNYVNLDPLNPLSSIDNGFFSLIKAPMISADETVVVGEEHRRVILSNNDPYRVKAFTEFRVRNNDMFGLFKPSSALHGIHNRVYPEMFDFSKYPKFAFNRSDDLSIILEKKAAAKQYIQDRYFGKISDNPVFFTCSRLVEEQKQMKTLYGVAKELLEEGYDIQFFVMGDGDKNIYNLYYDLSTKYPHNLVVVPFDPYLQPIVSMASYDLSVSKREPGGYNPLIALYLLSLSVLTPVEGLLEFYNTTGFGIMAKGTSFNEIKTAILEAAELYKNPGKIFEIVQEMYKITPTWDDPKMGTINKYVALINDLIERKKEEQQYIVELKKMFNSIINTSSFNNKTKEQIIKFLTIFDLKDIPLYFRTNIFDKLYKEALSALGLQDSQVPQQNAPDIKNHESFNVPRDINFRQTPSKIEGSTFKHFKPANLLPRSTRR